MEPASWWWWTRTSLSDFEDPPWLRAWPPTRLLRHRCHLRLLAAHMCLWLRQPLCTRHPWKSSPTSGGSCSRRRRSSFPCGCWPMTPPSGFRQQWLSARPPGTGTWRTPGWFWDVPRPTWRRTSLPRSSFPCSKLTPAPQSFQPSAAAELSAIAWFPSPFPSFPAPFSSTLRISAASCLPSAPMPPNNSSRLVLYQMHPS
jgi:hypothetical protein